MEGCTKKHATDDVDAPEKTLCGEKLPPKERCAFRIDNTDPDCKRCLKVIAARLRKVAA